MENTNMLADIQMLSLITSYCSVSSDPSLSSWEW